MPGAVSICRKWWLVRFQERCLVKERMLSKLFADDGCDKSFIQGLASGMSYRCKMDFSSRFGAIICSKVVDKVVSSEFPQH